MGEGSRAGHAAGCFGLARAMTDETTNAAAMTVSTFVTSLATARRHTKIEAP